MNRTNRVALAGAAVLLLAVSGTVLATRAPARNPDRGAPAASSDIETEDGTPSTEALAHAADRLAAHDITVDSAALADLAGRYGIGGAVRLLAWADESGRSVDELAAMRDGDGTEGSGMGWGRMAKELGVHPGIGSIMGGGQGADHANQAGDEESQGSGD